MPQVQMVYPGVVRAGEFRDGFLNWVWRGVALGCGFTLLSIIISLVAALLLFASGGTLLVHP